MINCETCYALNVFDIVVKINIFCAKELIKKLFQSKINTLRKSKTC